MNFFVLGLSDGLKSGNLGYRVHNVLAVLHSLSASEGCSPAVIQSSVASSLRSAMRKASSLILEPYMEIEVTSSSDVVGDVMDDVTDRRSGEVKSAVAEENGSGLVRVVFVAPLKKVSQRKLIRLLISYALILVFLFFCFNEIQWTAFISKYKDELWEQLIKIGEPLQIFWNCSLIIAKIKIQAMVFKSCQLDESMLQTAKKNYGTAEFLRNTGCFRCWIIRRKRE